MPVRTLTRKLQESLSYALLTVADALIVTSDGIAMLTEACATQKRV